jgi:exopolysaccharide production protein ExoQ
MGADQSSYVKEDARGRMELNRAVGHPAGILKGPPQLNRTSSNGRGNSQGRGLGFISLIPFIAFSYVLIFGYLFGSIAIDGSPLGSSAATDPAPNLANRIFWPLLFIVTIVLAFCHRSRIQWDFFRTPAVVSLIAFLTFAGASITWAYSPEHAFNRYVFQLMLIATVVLPYALEVPHKDILKSLCACYALAIALNAVLVLNENPTLTAAGTVFGYRGYFTFKGYLGECASVAILTSFYALRSRGWLRFFAIFSIPISLWLILMSESKGSLAVAILSPLLAGAALLAAKYLKISLSVFLTIIAGFYFVASMVSGDLITKLAYTFYGDSTLTGRTIIWDFVQNQMWQHRWFGWGFHSFWLVGPNAPSVTQAPEQWIKHMTGSHSGYLDVKLETGNLGFSLFICFILATLQAIGRVIKVDPFRAWILLTLATFAIITNMLETVWVCNDPLWVVFILIVMDTTRYRKQANRIALTLERHSPISTSHAVVRPVSSTGKAGGFRLELPGAAGGSADAAPKP